MLHRVWCRGVPPNKLGTLFNLRQDTSSRAADKYNRLNEFFMFKYELVGSCYQKLNVGPLEAIA